MSSATASGSAPSPISNGRPSSMKQSLLAFKPRTSSQLAVQSSGSEEETTTPPPRVTNGGTQQASDDPDSSTFDTPPPRSSRPSLNGHQDATTSYITIEDSDDDDLSDPPPLKSITADRPKKLTKKRPASSNSSSSVIGASNSKKVKQASPSSGATADAAPRKPAAHGESPLCHQHRTLCSEDLLRCTHVRGKGVRCALKFCDRALTTHYGTSQASILERGRTVTDDIDPTEHVSSREASYFFKCPRCTATCYCSVCRKKEGLPPLGPAKKPRNSSVADGSDPASSDRAKAKPRASLSAASEKQKQSSSAAENAPSGSKTSKRAVSAKTASATDTKSKGKGKGKNRDSEEKTKKGGASKGVKASFFNGTTQSKSAQTALNSWKTARQTSLPRPLKPPVPVAAPELEVIPTQLHRENFDARAWIYETLVRFDFIKAPKATLSQLDRFDQWSHRQMQMILERILTAIAGIRSIHSGVPKAGTTESVKAYRKYGEDLSRGEPWQAARRFCETSNVDVLTLPHVDRVFQDESKDAPVTDPGPTLLGSRSTRARRAAEVKALERVKMQSLADMDRDIDSDSDLSDVQPRGRGHRARRKVDYNYVDSYDDEEDEEEAGDQEGLRKSGRQTARQMAIAEGRERNTSPEGVRRSGRAKRAIAIEDSEEESRDRADGSAAPSTRSSTRPDSVSESRDSSAVPVEDDAAAAPPIEAEPVPAPAMEDKVAIVCALLDVVMQSSAVGEELKQAGARLVEIEKLYKEDMRDLEKEWDEMKLPLNTGAPSITQPELFAKWKKDKEKKEKNFKLRILDAKVNAYRETEANKLRTGPLGVDADGREFWQLTEFNESMPANTGGKWSWCVLVYGEPLTKHAPPASAMPNNAPNVSPQKASAGGQGGSDVDDNEDAKISHLNGGPSTPSKVKQGGDDELATPPRKAEAEDDLTREDSLTPLSPTPVDTKVFMGTNYPPSIKEVISFLKYRYMQLDYEELRAQRDAEEASSSSVEDVKGASPSAGTASAAVGVSRKAKRQLKEAQEERKKRVDELCEKLESCRRYYMWHAAEVDEGDVASTF